MARYPEWLYTGDASAPADIERHERERVESGVSFFDWINFNEYLSHIIVEGMNRFIEKTNTHPATLTPEEWTEVLTTIRDGFQAHLDFERNIEYKGGYVEHYKVMKEKRDAAFTLMVHYYDSIWD
jgi:hypothetical protein